jgi:DNA-binding transcriptional MocR family regulator
VIEKLVLIKQASDLHTATLSQMVMHEVAVELIEPHAKEICEVYKARRDAMLAALDAYMPAGVTWTRPAGGMFVWLTLPEPIDGGELLDQAIEQAGVAFVPGRAFFADGAGRNTIRLNFSLADQVSIDAGIQRLGQLLARKFIS